MTHLCYMTTRRCKGANNSKYSKSNDTKNS